MKSLCGLAGIIAVSLLLSGCCSEWCSDEGAGEKAAAPIKMLSTAEMQKIVQDKSALIFDARTGKYDTGERIPGAKSLSRASSADEVARNIPDKGAAVVTYCSSTKCPASGYLAEHLLKLGYTNIMEYPEGIEGWKNAGNSVEQAKQ